MQFENMPWSSEQHFLHFVWLGEAMENGFSPRFGLEMNESTLCQAVRSWQWGLLSSDAKVRLKPQWISEAL